MLRKFTASVWQEDVWYVAHCNEIEIASQGLTKIEALENLKEAIELHYEEPTATVLPEILSFEANIYAY